MIPDFQSVFLPFLKFHGDGKPHTTNEAEEYLANFFHLTDTERQELLPSGKQARFRNRVAWTASHLKQARLVEPVSRGVYQITDRGQEVLRENPLKLNLPYLMRFPEFQEFRMRRSVPEEETKAEQTREEHSTQTPEELLEGTYQALRNILARELLEKIKASSPFFFEQVVIDLLVAMGYGGSRIEAASLTKRGSDDGIDGIIKEDKLGLDTIYVQAKRWDGVVGRPVVQAFSGSLDGVRARKGVLLTTSRFSSDALDYVARIEKKIVLIDGEKLADLMIEHNVGVSEAQRYVIKKVDADYFGEE
jgi:restriction system protein